MIRFLAIRLVQAVAIVFLVVTATFFLIRLAPGDPYTTVTDRHVPPEVVDYNRHLFGFDQPIARQYVTYLRRLSHGDLGLSHRTFRPVAERIRGALPNTILLGFGALLVNFAFGIAVGAVQAARYDQRLDHLLSLVTLTLFSIPAFWLGLLAIDLLAVNLGWFPTGGTMDVVTGDLLPFGRQLLQRLHHLVLPALTLGLVSGAWTARYMRAEMLDVLARDYVRTAWAKGLPPRRVVIHHIARTALMPIVTLFGMFVPVLLSGAVFIEYVFAWHGLGWEAAKAVETYDYPMITALTTLTAAMVVLGNLVADILYRIADPRTVSS